MIGIVILALTGCATGQIHPSKLVEIAGDHTKCCGGVNVEGGTLTGGYPLEDGDRLGRSSAAIGDLDGDSHTLFDLVKSDYPKLFRVSSIP